MELNGKHQTGTTYLGDDFRIFCGQLLKTCFQEFALLFADTRNIIFKHILDRSKCGRTAYRVSAKGRRTKKPWIVDKLLCPHFRLADNTGDWHDAAAESFTKCHDIRSNTLSFTAPHSTGTTHTGLDLIKDQCYACLITDLANLCQISIRRNDNTGLALNWLQDHTGNLLADCLEILNRLADILCNTILYMLYLLYHWNIRGTICTLTTHRDSTH